MTAELTWTKRDIVESDVELAILQEDHLSCPDCKIPLLTITKIGESDKKIVIQAKHKNCGNKSFVKRYTGECYIGPIGESQIINIEEEKYTVVEVQT
jgi:hypothetical protein